MKIELNEHFGDIILCLLVGIILGVALGVLFFSSSFDSTEQPVVYSERYFTKQYQGYTVLCDKVEQYCYIPFPVKAE